MADLQHVSPGEPVRFSAGVWNAMIDAAALAKRDGGGRNGAGVPGGGDWPASLTVLVRNDTGGDLDAFAVLTPTDPLADATTQPHRVNAEAGYAADAPYLDPVVITVEPVRAGLVGRAVVSGLAVVNVLVEDAGHPFAGFIPGDTAKLASADAGPALVLWREPGLGVRRAVVLLGVGESMPHAGGSSGSSGAARGSNSFVVHRNPRCENGHLVYDAVTVTAHGPVWFEED